MSLNIKNERTHALVRELAALTGMSQTSAVEDAVRRRLDVLLAQDAAARVVPVPAKFPAAETARRRIAIERILDELHAQTSPEQWEALDRADEELYDEQGLPR